ncbi:hypothetical protein ACLOJK_029127 [Asimina triloba]
MDPAACLVEGDIHYLKIRSSVPTARSISVTPTPIAAAAPATNESNSWDQHPCFSSLVLLRSLIALVPLSSSFSTQQADKPQFKIRDIEDVVGRSFDYIIVGGGTSGCPLAATLSQNYSVLLVERGGSPYGNPLIEERRNFGFPFFQTDEFTSISQQFISKEGVVNQRGRVLGGSTAINGGFYSRASEEYIKGAGWDPELVRGAYEWAESKIVFRPSLTAWQSVAADGMVEAGIRPFNGFSLEHLQGTKVGGSIFDAHGRRHTSADLLAAAGDSNKITLLLNATVQNVIFHDAGRGKQPRAHGIRFIRSNGNPNKFYDVYINHPNKVSRSWGDVILCAGAMGSPQILMLSGIGPKEHLTHFNITPLIDVRSVGQSMQDNPAIIIPLNYSSHALQKLHDPDPSQVVGIVNGLRIIIEAAVFYPSFNTSIQPVMGGKLAYPVSRGSLRLVSADPRQNPSAKFNYLAKEKDLDECVKMVPLIEEVAQSRSISAFLGRRQSRLSSKEGTSSSYRKELRDLCKKNVKTIYHYHGGCLVGSVVDRDYRVFRVRGLRVVDGSTLRDSPGTNPMATLLMLGRYQGIKMLRERERNINNL